MERKFLVDLSINEISYIISALETYGSEYRLIYEDDVKETDALIKKFEEVIDSVDRYTDS